VSITNYVVVNWWWRWR